MKRVAVAVAVWSRSLQVSKSKPCNQNLAVVSVFGSFGFGHIAKNISIPPHIWALTAGFNLIVFNFWKFCYDNYYIIKSKFLAFMKTYSLH